MTDTPLASTTFTSKVSVMVYAESLGSFALPANLKRKAVQVFVAVVLATPALVKPPPASAVIRGSSFYTIVNGLSWTQAEANAVGLGGHLVTITSAKENDFIRDSFMDPIARAALNGGERRIWIGLREVSVNNWQWTSGEVFSYSNWFNDPISGQEPNNLGGAEDYALMYLDADGKYPDSVGYWNDGNLSDAYSRFGIAEIPIAFSASQSASPIEGSGLFTTSLFFSAGVGSNLVNGETIYWGLDGISADDLASGSMTGFGVVTNGQLDITHSLLDDGLDDIENFIVTAYSDPILRTSDYQIGTYSAPVRSATSSTASVPGPLPILGLSSVFYWTRRLRKRIKNSKATLRIASAE